MKMWFPTANIKCAYLAIVFRLSKLTSDRGLHVLTGCLTKAPLRKRLSSPSPSP